jgi:hypothetical protein
MTGNQVAARAQSLQRVFGSELWRRSIVAEDATVRAVSAVLTYGVSDERLQRTALCADKIAAILSAGIGPTAFLIYRCAAAEAQAVGPPPPNRTRLRPAPSRPSRCAGPTDELQQGGVRLLQLSNID